MSEQDSLVERVALAERRARAARAAQDAARTEVQEAEEEARTAWGNLRDFQDRLVKTALEKT